ncbi:hypothetical protein RGF97_13935 [Streptomyces roseicoloratus]|uniref:Transposase n=1 Tax=Streptomyces roseicoloratus TaxID=2508722 RepID=A0ABY9RVL2_9ACTN|nr:hypothetical protein [Streptomyces roseicoloratus]WMX45733.1 hypothetical protein RGF97_13935 [Streptomyces roseicoloratus]
MPTKISAAAAVAPAMRADQRWAIPAMFPPDVCVQLMVRVMRVMRVVQVVPVVPFVQLSLNAP